MLADSDDVAHAAPFAHMLAGIGQVLPRVVDAYRTGGGVPYHAYGSDFRHGQGHINRPAFTHELPTAWLAAMPDVVTRLQTGRRTGRRRRLRPGLVDDRARARLPRSRHRRARPRRRLDRRGSPTRRRRRRRRRARFLAGDATELPQHGPYDLVAILEALHDMAHPVDALAAARAALAPDGAVLVVDERVADTFTAPGDEVERMMYGWSVTHCLPTQLAEQPSAALGTVLRAGTVRDLAHQAGFARVELLPVENEFFRLYRLHP